MDISSQIKEAFKKKNRVGSSQYDQRSQYNIYALDIFLRKSGYTLSDVVRDSNDQPKLVIKALKNDYAHPKISRVKGEFFIEVKAYGDVIVSDLDMIMQGYTTAKGLVEHISKINLDELEVE